MPVVIIAGFSDNVSNVRENRGVNVITYLVFLAIATYISYRGITTTERIQIVLVLFQLAVLAIFAIAAFAKSADSATRISFDIGWFSPSGLTLSAFVAGLSGSIFAFWAGTPHSPSTRSRSTPTRRPAAPLCCASCRSC
jgi:amino acid transporter